jgi:hypothetical protein
MKTPKVTGTVNRFDRDDPKNGRWIERRGRQYASLNDTPFPFVVNYAAHDFNIMMEGRYELIEYDSNGPYTTLRDARNARSKLAARQGVPSIYIGIWDRIMNRCA